LDIGVSRFAIAHAERLLACAVLAQGEHFYMEARAGIGRPLGIGPHRTLTH
jgi:hypothetical protein